LDADPDVPVLGYVDDWSVTPGEVASFRVSCLGSQYRARIVRIVAGGPRVSVTDNALRYEEVDAACAGLYPAVRRQIVSGSYAEFGEVELSEVTAAVTLTAWIFPTLPAASRRQEVLGWRGVNGGAIALEITGSGHVAAVLGDGAGKVTLPAPLHPYTWYFVAAMAGDGELAVFSQEIRPPGRLTAEPMYRTAPAQDGRLAGAGRVLVAATSGQPARPDAETTVCTGAYNGKVEAPAIMSRRLTAAELAELAPEPAAVIKGQAGLAWHADFTKEPEELPGLTLVSSPMRRMTGHTWRGEALDWRVSPAEYGAIWFHDDDLDDARWPVAFTWEVPPGTRSGMYAAHLTCEYGEDFLPFYVRPPAGQPSARLAVWMPTFTYMAYSNHFWDEPPPERGHVPDGVERYLSRHREVGSSLYSRHRDGSGIAHVSWRRPMPDVRPETRVWTRGNAGRELSGDLYLIDWLEHAGISYDVITDLDVHREGASLLGSYRCVVTGGHPEYVSAQMLDAIESYVEQGGHFMYLGGNGYYWVTAVDRHVPHVLEVRRGRAGSRPWTGMPGEGHHTDGGEPGGQWRERGRAPQAVMGVGFCAQGGGPALPFTRTQASEDPRCSFIFEGIGRDELIGDFGSKQGGAAGDELDRVDFSLGSPRNTVLIATSAGRYDNSYQHVVEEVEEMNGRQGGADSPYVRADMTYYETQQGGAVFSVGSISWSASLSHDNGANNVARITRNVIEHFTG
jgi:N,N-dimethylformamidase